MRLDLIIPTYGRPDLLKKTLKSIRRAVRPEPLAVHVVVVDNAGDLTSAAVADVFHDSAVFNVTLLKCSAPGKSHALNAGLAACDGDYVGFIDDDEEIDPTWFTVVHAELSRDRLDFIGGPTRPLCHDPLPAWVPDQYQAVLGIVDGGDEPLPYGISFTGILTGGNSVVSRAALTVVGPFSPALGPRRDKRLFSCEDEDLYWRLVDAGARGRYLPNLVVYHHIHRQRLSKRYYRQWCFWNGASKAVLRKSRPEAVPHLAGIPGYLIGRGLRGLAASALRANAAESRRFASELAIWELAGFAYGRHFYRSPRNLSTEAVPVPAATIVDVVV